MTPKPEQVVRVLLSATYAKRDLYLHSPFVSPGSLERVTAAIGNDELLVVLDTPDNRPSFWIKCLTTKGQVGWLFVLEAVVQLSEVKTP